MDNRSIQNEKLIAEALPTNFLPRESISQLFAKNTDKRIIFLQAPGGYGKTTSTIHWLSASQSTPLWISLDEYDNLPGLFYKICCNALLVAQPDNIPLHKIVADPEFTSSPVEYTILALAAFSTNQDVYTLVLDDFHVITNPKIIKSLPFILKRLSLSTKIVILSRRELPDDLTNHYGEDKIGHITADDLAFSETDVSLFYQQTGYQLSTAENQQIYKQTKGWPIALQTLAMSPAIALPQNETENRLSAFIEKQLWDKWSTATRELLLKLSVLEEITSELCLIVTEDPQAFDYLQQLALENMMIQSVTDETFRYHDLFTEFLRGKIHENPQLIMTDVYSRLTQYYLKQNDLFKARQAAINSRDEDLMIVTLLNDSQYQDYKESTEQYVDTILKFQAMNIPAVLFEREPAFHLIPAWYYYLTGRGTKLAEHIDQLLLNFAKIAVDSPHVLEEIVLVCGLDTRQTLLEKTSSITQFVSLPDTPSKTHSGSTISLTLQVPFLHRGLIDYYELANLEARALTEPHFKVLLQHAFEQTMTTVYAGLATESNDLQKAYQLATQGFAKINDETNHELYFALSMQLLHLHYLLGNRKDFQQLKHQLENWLNVTSNYYLTPNYAAYTHRLGIWSGQRDQAEAWLDSYYVTPSDSIEIYRLFQHFTTIRAYLLTGRTHEGILLGEKILAFAQEFQRLADEAEVTTLLAISYWSLGHQKQALFLMKDIIEKTEPYHFIRVYADEGAALLPILSKLRNRLNQLPDSSQTLLTYLSQILVLTKEVANKKPGILPIATSAHIKLSKQQLRMIELLAEGHKFSEIVTITNLSINTIRAHVSLAYQKLQVNNSSDAVNKAKELNLL